MICVWQHAFVSSRPKMSKCFITGKVNKNITQFVEVGDSLHQRRTWLNWTNGLSGGVAAVHDFCRAAHICVKQVENEQVFYHRKIVKNITQFVEVCNSLHQRRTGLNWTSGLSGGVAAHDLFGWVWQQLQQQIDNPSHKQSFHTIPLTRLFMPISTRGEYSHTQYLF
jgi:hypothetical protein